MLVTRRIAALVAASLLGLAGCTDHPTQPRPVARRPVAQLDADGRMPIVIGTTARGVARLEVALAGDEKPRWVLENPLPDYEEAWGGIALEPGAKYELAIHAYDAEGRERFTGSLIVPVEGEAVPQVRADAELAGDPTGSDKLDPPTVYAGSYRVEMSPRWDPETKDGVAFDVWVHDADGARLDLSPDDVKGWTTPEIGTLDVVYGDRELRELVLTMHPYIADDGPPPPDTRLTFCVYGDLTCDHTVFKDPPPDPYVKVVGGERLHTCALRASGRARCWGQSGVALPGTATVNELAAFRFIDIDLALDHGCAIDTAHQAWCWGGDFFGELGSGTIGDPPTATPRLVTGGHRFVHITTGDSHSCAIDTAGQVWCWGSSEFGQLGDGSGGSIGNKSGTPVRAKLQTGTAVAIAAGESHTCALTSSRQVECWGLNDSEQIGVPAGIVSQGCSMTFCNREPAVVSRSWTSDPPVAIGAGGAQSCALTAAGSVFCWGIVTGANLPTDILIIAIPTRVGATAAFEAIGVGSAHGCAITKTHEAVCWGNNTSQQLGIGPTSKAIPGGSVLVQNPLASYGSLGLGKFQSCAISDDRLRLYCWGERSAFDGFAGTPGPVPPMLVTTF